MSDDFKIRFRETYNVHASTAKRDHVTDNAVHSLPGNAREHKQRRHRDRAEFSAAPPEDQHDETEAGGKESGQHNDASGPAEDAAPHEATPRDEALGPGTILDLKG